MKRIFLVALVLTVIIAALAGATAYFGLWPVAATTTPPRWESRLGQSALRASLSRQAADLRNPIEPSNDVLLTGQKLFMTNCAGCHGTPGHPSQWGTQNFYPPVPQFGDQSPNLTAPQMFLAVKYGIRYSGMGGWNGMMSDEDIWKVATLLEHIGSLPPEIQENWKRAQ
jgi:mono/diheme cytochrome c family protein